MAQVNEPGIRIPDDLLPADGRFGCGPSRVRVDAVRGLAEEAGSYLGTSHRQEGVRSVVRRIRTGLAELLRLPEGYEVALGNGGSTCFWDCATFGLIERRSQHLSFGEFSSKFAAAVAGAPHLDPPHIIESAPGTHPEPIAAGDVDAYALTQNETSTGVAMPILRPQGARGLVLVDATSGAGGLRVDPAQFDAYYFAPQKCFAGDGGLWVAALSSTAVERIERIAASRWMPAFLNLKVALDNSRLDQTYNTPALATLWLLADQVEWMLAEGGLEWAASRCERSSGLLYTWAETSAYAQPFVKDPSCRSTVVCTIDLEEPISAPLVSKVLRRNGIVDTEAYRKLGRNQLRIGVFPATDPADVEALIHCIDHVVARLG